MHIYTCVQTQGFTEFIEVIKEWGGDASLQNAAGANPVHYALACDPPHLDAALALVVSIKDIYSVLHWEPPLTMCLNWALQIIPNNIFTYLCIQRHFEESVPDNCIAMSACSLL